LSFWQGQVYLEALLPAEIAERERNTLARRLRDAHLTRMKTLEEFDFSQSPKISAAEIRQLAESGYIERAEPQRRERTRNDPKVRRIPLSSSRAVRLFVGMGRSRNAFN
jgi:hypothetical protein